MFAMVIVRVTPPLKIAKSYEWPELMKDGPENYWSDRAAGRIPADSTDLLFARRSASRRRYKTQVVANPDA